MLEIRRIRADEREVAGGVTVAAYADYTQGARDPYLPRLADVATRDREAEVFVAVRGGRVVGCVTSCPPGSPWRELSTPTEGEFRMLAVLPDERGRGTGQALVEICEQRAREDGAVGMVLCSLPEMAAAHRLYHRLGYRRDPDRDWAPLPGVDLFAFAKELRP